VIDSGIDTPLKAADTVLLGVNPLKRPSRSSILADRDHRSSV
jgi:hypothetical protein